MKKILFLGLVLLFVGCGDKKSDGSSRTEDIQEVKDVSKIEVSDGQAVDKNDIVAQFTSYNVDGEKVVQIAPNGEETASSRQIGAIITIKNQYENLSASLLSKRLSHNFIVKCSACHDDYANGIIGPSLLTKTSEDIFQKIIAYRSGTKKNVFMKELVHRMSDKEIRELADEIAKFNTEVREKK